VAARNTTATAIPTPTIKNGSNTDDIVPPGFANASRMLHAAR
jgi:hypothetical protein